MGQRLSYWIFLGVIGFAAFFVLHSTIAFNGDAPIKESRSTIEGKTAQLAGQLGFSVDSLQVMTRRTQHLNYYRALRDSTEGPLPSIGVLNKRGANLTGWKTSIGVSQDPDAGFSQENFLNQLGRLEIRYDQQGQVRRLSSVEGTANPTFVAGDSLFSIASHI